MTSALEDKNRDGIITRAMRDFNRFKFNFDLVDIPLSGAKYIWSNFQENPVCSRIDRFLLNQKWDEFYPGSLQTAKPRPVSDHIPIMLSTDFTDTGPRPRKLETMWLEHDDIKRLVHEWWDSLHFTGNPGFVFCKKLKGFMDYLSIWNIENLEK